MTAALPDPQADPGGYVLAAAEAIRRMGTHGYGFETAHGRFYVGVADFLLGVAERHSTGSCCSGPADFCGWCNMTAPCPDLLAAVAAAQAYAGAS